MEARTIVQKLILTGHLNHPEKRWLPDGMAKGCQLCEVFEDLLNQGRWFHAWWVPDDSMFGCTVRYRGDQMGKIERRISRTDGESTAVEIFPTTKDAAESLVMELKEYLGSRLDGVPVLWSA